jgi:hypothetical protein
MSRRTVALAVDDDPRLRQSPYEEIKDPLIYEKYVSVKIDGSPFERLLWREIKQIEKSCHMTVWQCVCFEWYLRGFTIDETAKVFDRDRSTIHEHLHKAKQKAMARRRGMLTVMIETFGEDGAMAYLREVLADVVERRNRKTRV